MLQMRSVFVITFLMLVGAPINAHPVATRPHVVVANFMVNDTERDSNLVLLSWSLAELMTNRLINLRAVEVRDRRMTQNAGLSRGAMPSGRGDSLPTKPEMPIPGALFTVNGSVLLAGDRVLIQTSLIDVRTGTLIARASEEIKQNENPQTALDSLAALISRVAISKQQGLTTGSTTPAQTSPPGASAAAESIASASAVFSPVGLLTFGRALRLASTGADNQAAAIAMLRTAAVEEPPLAADVEQILKRWGSRKRSDDNTLLLSEHVPPTEDVWQLRERSANYPVFTRT